MEKMKRKDSILGLCDSALQIVSSIRNEYYSQTASERDMLCGEWGTKGGNISLSIYETAGRYFIEERFTNDINDRVRSFCKELLEDENSNLYVEGSESAIGYDRDHDTLRHERLGIFERKKTGNEK